jgi:hypothetical protein
MTRTTGMDQARVDLIECADSFCVYFGLSFDSFYRIITLSLQMLLVPLMKMSICLSPMESWMSRSIANLQMKELSIFITKQRDDSQEDIVE